MFLLEFTWPEQLLHVFQMCKRLVGCGWPSGSSAGLRTESSQVLARMSAEFFFFFPSSMVHSVVLHKWISWCLPEGTVKVLSQETLTVFRLHTFKIDIKCTKICGLLVAYWLERWTVTPKSQVLVSHEQRRFISLPGYLTNRGIS